MINNNYNSIKLCLVIGDPITGSLSPLMHNAAYRELQLEREFLFIASQVSSSNLSDAIKGARALGLRGISCTMPHKESVMALLDSVDPVAKKIGAVNTIVNNDGNLHGCNTDWLGIVRPLEEIAAVKGKKIAILGAGGAARAACYGLAEGGAEIRVFNRSIERAKKLADEFGGISFQLSELKEIKASDIILNTIPYNNNKNNIRDDSFTINDITRSDIFLPKHIVFDIVYNPLYTPLLTAAKVAKAKVVFGMEMFVQQGGEQFKLYTHRDPPLSRMRKVILDTLSRK